MKKILIFILLLFGTVKAEELYIPKELRVKNLLSGCCVWASIETLGNVHNIKRLQGLTKYRDEKFGKLAPGDEKSIKEELNRLGINYDLQVRGIYDTKLIEYAVEKELGVAIAVKDFPAQNEIHMVTLVNLTKNNVMFYDSRDLNYYEGSRKWFDESWTGLSLVIYPDKIKIQEERENKKITIKEEKITK